MLGHYLFGEYSTIKCILDNKKLKSYTVFIKQWRKQ